MRPREGMGFTKVTQDLNSGLIQSQCSGPLRRGRRNGQQVVSALRAGGPVLGWGQIAARCVQQPAQDHEQSVWALESLPIATGSA